MFASGKTAAVASAANYIEDVFSTYLYTGTGGTQTITNGIDLSTKGGLVWIKTRNVGTTNHQLFDTDRGISNTLLTNNNGLQQNVSPYGVSTFSSSGFNASDTTNGGYQVNGSNTSQTYVSWTFRKQPKFFDIVTWTGDGVAGRVIPHNLGSTPGCILVKRVDGGFGEDWYVYHRSLNANQNLVLNSTAAAATNSPAVFGTVDSTGFQLTNSGAGNSSGYPYVAYLFAHDAGGFGLTGTDNVISCGSYTGNGSATGPVINLGYEPQWVMAKAASTTGDWFMVDTMRGQGVSGSTSQQLKANTSGAEAASNFIAINSTGFQLTAAVADKNGSGQTYIYIAIRRGPMKVPTSGTSVFDVDLAGNSSAPTMTSAFPVDLGFIFRRSGGDSWYWVDRLRGTPSLSSDTTAAEASFPTLGKFDYMNGYGSSTTLTSYTGWNFRRAPSFFDEVCYTGTGSAMTFTHNLGVAPELMIVKSRTGVTDWFVYSTTLGATKWLWLNDAGTGSTGSTIWNNTAPTSSVFSVGTSGNVNGSGSTYVAYLFATCAGVSKVGTYTGTGTTKQIDCGFTGGARFVLIKRTDSAGDWYVWDTARGIVSGNDPYLLLNSTAAETTGTDYIDPYSAGFEISSTAPAAINASGGTFIFLAIA